jgi:hypothetical protein
MISDTNSGKPIDMLRPNESSRVRNDRAILVAFYPPERAAIRSRSS